MSNVTPQPGILEISPYVGGSSTLPGQTNATKLSSNENPYGPSPKAVEAAHRAVLDMHRYPSTDHAALRDALARTHGLRFDQIICGAGSDEIFTFLCQAYTGPGGEVIVTEHGFSMHRICALAAGAAVVTVEEKDRVVDVDAILEAVGPRTQLIFIANPANPTGTLLPMEDVTRLAHGLPENVLLVLDGAYVEFAPGYDGGASLVHSLPNVIMTRTFSKLYGLGGMRIGWGYAPTEVIDILNRVRGPFNLSQAALAAAEAALDDTVHIKRTLSENARLRDWMTGAFRDLGIAVDDSLANYILARFANEAAAADCYDALAKDGLITRKVGGYGFPEGLRITVGDEASCRQVVHCVTQHLNRTA